MAFTYRQKIKFRHCDPAGIVFYPRFFEMTNDTVEAFFDREIGFPFSGMHEVGGVPTAEISATFKRPSRLGDVLDIDLRCTKLGRSSLGLSYEARCADELRFTAESTIVFIDLNGKPTPWPEHIRRQLEQHL